MTQASTVATPRNGSQPSFQAFQLNTTLVISVVDPVCWTQKRTFLIVQLQKKDYLKH